MAETRYPEAATGVTVKKAVIREKFMVSAANPHATRAGYNVLKKGGNAVDAAIAIQAVLTLVEPQSSGIGGGAFALYWDNKKKELSTFDGRETAPKAADENLFLDKNGKPMNWWDALAGGRSVGVPGVLALMSEMHRLHGRLAWSELFEEAIGLCEKGFKVSKRLHLLVARKMNPALGRYDEARKYFFPGGKPIKEGDLIKNVKLADTLRRIAREGTNAFYRGDIASDMVRAVRNAKDNPGLLTELDLRNYTAKRRPPVCGDYKTYKICGMGPPSSGGLTVIQILSLLENKNLGQYSPVSVESAHLITQASKLAFADRAVYMADSDFVKVPINGLIDRDYLRKRAQQINHQKDMGEATAGNPPGRKAAHVPAQSFEKAGTSHFSIVDAEGNAISMTSSIEMAFGSTLMARGFLLNNQLTDFSFSARKKGAWVANRVQGGKRPRSSMSPMMVFDKNNNPVLIVGSPGGSRIINYVAKTIVAVLDWKLDIQDALDLPHYVNRNGSTDLESNTAAENLKGPLEKMGHKTKIRELNSGLHAIVIRGNKLHGGADSRREGIVLGD